MKKYFDLVRRSWGHLHFFNGKKEMISWVNEKRPHLIKDVEKAMQNDDEPFFDEERGVLIEKINQRVWTIQFF